MRRHSVAGRAAPLILALGLLLAGGSATHPQLAQANPVLPSAYLIHVHPPEANDCMVGTVTTCEEVIETSSATGTLQFDLYLFSNYGLDQYWVDGLLTLVAWSAGWEVLLWEVCHDGVGSVDIDGNVAEVNLHWPGGAWTHDEVFLAAQFLVQVPAHGFFGQLESYAGVASLHTQNGSLILHPAQHAAEAGMSCGTCSTPCPLHGYCRPFLEPTVIDLEVVTGETTETSVDVNLYRTDFTGCDVEYGTDAEWMTPSVEETGPSERLVTLDIDATSLAPGSYEGELRATEHCVGCALVRLEVLPEPQPVLPATWGQVKAVYR